MNYLLTLLLTLVSLSAFAQRGKWKYDFIVPDNGGFVQAIHAANNRPDKSKRYRIFLRPSNYRIKGDGNIISTEENGKRIEFPSPITTLTAPNTSIIGDAMNSVQIESCPQHEGISITSTLYLKGADSTYIQDVEIWSNFKNDPNLFANRAVAVNEKGCKGNIYKHVALRGTQDTYWTNDGGTSYLEDCQIMGTVDFICGGGTIFFNHCTLKLLPRGDSNSRDCITAPSTAEGLKYGYVFSDCSIVGPDMQDGRYVLGRPWKNAPKAVFLNTVMNVKPAPHGWTDMHGTLPAQFAEYESLDFFYRPIDLSQRKTMYKNTDGQEVKVPFLPVVSAEESEKYSLVNVFPDWEPEHKAQQVCPPELHLDGRTITWEDNPDAGCYVVCRDRKIVTFTTTCSYTIPAGTYEGACYSVRAANWYGGLGEYSKEVVYPNRKK